MANRLPVLLLAGDIFASRAPDPVLQQVEHFDNPTITVNDAFKPVTRYWDRITRPEQIISSLPQAVATMLDPADCGPAFLGLCQDVQARGLRLSGARSSSRASTASAARGPTRGEIRAAAAAAPQGEEAADHRRRRRALFARRGGARRLRREAQHAGRRDHRRARPRWSTTHPMNVGPIGVIGSASANALAGEADVVLAIGTRLQDFTTGSWSVFARRRAHHRASTPARFDAAKHRALSVVGDARAAIEELAEALGDWRAPDGWAKRGAKEYAALERAGRQGAPGPTNAERAELRAGGRRGQPHLPTRPTSRSPPPAACRASSARTGG